MLGFRLQPHGQIDSRDVAGNGSFVSITPSPVPASHCLSSLLHAIHCCLAAVSKVEGHGVNKGRAKPLSCSKLSVTEVRC